MFYGAVLLTGANLALRLVAMSFQVYLSGRIGAAGIGLLQLIFSVAGLSYTMASAGVRICAMYLSAEELGKNRPQGIHGVLSGCFQYSLCFSTAVALCLWHFAPWLSQTWIGDGAAARSLRIYAAFLPVTCLVGVMTGYFTAAGRIRELVVVDFLEQGCSMLVTLTFLFRWAGASPGRACASVVAGGCGAALFSFSALFFLYRRSMPPKAVEKIPVYKRILRMALPLGVADDLRSGLNAIENLIVPRQLSRFGGTVNAMADYGIVCGMVFPVMMFPAAILFALAELLVPELSRCAAGKRRVRVKYLARRSLRVALLFGLAAGGVLFANGQALGQILYHNPEVGKYLRLYAPLVPMLYCDAIVDAMCKGLGQQNANVRYNTLTSFLDVTFLWFLLPRLGLGGYYFSFALTHLINFCLSLRRLILVAELTPRYFLPLRAALCALGAGGMTTLLPEGGGTAGVLLRGICYLLLLGLLWSLCRVVGRGDIRWLQGLVDSRRVRAYNDSNTQKEREIS